MFSKISIVTMATCFAFLAIAMSVSLLFGFALIESLVIGAALMFSSTIVSLKLIPTTTLHHQRTGDMMISVLLLQDIMAIVLILLISGGQEEVVAFDVVLLLVKLVLLVLVSFVFVKKVITELFKRFDTIREYAFLLSLGWGLLGAGIAEQLGLSYEVGAFIAGVSLATCPAALVIAEDLKPLRDFSLSCFSFRLAHVLISLCRSRSLLQGW